jgi:hypothetical protein
VELAKTCDLSYSRYQATVTGYCQEVAAVLPKSVPTINKKITLRPLSEIPDVFWFNKQMNYSLVKQNGKAPLIFVIAGTGASYNSPKMISLQKSLYLQGYHVISLSSPTFANYIVNSTGSEHMPGDLGHDAKNLYQVMQRVLAQTTLEDNIEVSSFSITGYSLGGAHSAFISYLDEQEKVFNFEKVLLINPPVSLYNSVNILDSYFDLNKNRDSSLAMFDTIFERFSQGYSMQESSEFTQDSIFELFKDANLTEAELKLLIGASFRMSSSDMIFALDATYNTGAVTYKNHNISKFESLTHSMQRVSDVTFVTYFTKGMLPRAQLKDASITKDELIYRYSLHAIEDYLRNSGKVYLVTNRDDIILAEGEVDYLQDVFGDKATFFERGGHCGNLDRASFVDYLNAKFNQETN